MRVITENLDRLLMRCIERTMATDLLVKEIEELIDNEIRPMGFVKKGKKWCRTTDETICQLQLRKDRWHPTQHYLEIYVSVLELNPSKALEEPVWHIFGSVFSPSVEEKVEWEKCLNTRHTIVSTELRQTRLVEILRQKLMPLLRSFETLQGIKRVLFSGELRAMGVRTELQDLTGYQA